jgi:hypothetical protein
MPVDDDEGSFYQGTLERTEANNHTILTESQERGWRKIENAESTEDIVQSTIVNEEAIYVNSTFKGT